MLEAELVVRQWLSIFDDVLYLTLYDPFHYFADKVMTMYLLGKNENFPDFF